VTTGFVLEDELPIAYAGALAYIIPSLSEGFGLPPLEAMACGIPVISSKESCMPEILGDAAHYFDPYSVNDMAQAMEKIISDEKLRKDLVAKGLEQVKKYDWDRTAKETLKVYKEALRLN
jgi:glycosyltransferase involved in cell wall biosynthesis